LSVQIATFRNLQEVIRDAGGALDRDAQPWLFDRGEWYRLVAEDMVSAEPLVVRARNEASACWLFLFRRGRSACAMANGYAWSFEPVVSPPKNQEAPLAALVRGLRQAGVSHVYLAPMVDPVPLARALKRRGWAVSHTAVDASWKIDTDGLSFADYWAQRPSRLRNTVARRARKVRLDFKILQRFDEAVLADYESVYEASWKPPEGAARLVRELARQAAAAGTLRLGVAYHQSRPIAAQLWLVENGQAMIHKLAYREDARELSAGTLLSVEMFRHVLDVDKVSLIDFGLGDHPYKAEWMARKVPLTALTAYDLLHPSGLLGLLRSAVRKLRFRLPLQAA
jgi:hypothetical protein